MRCCYELMQLSLISSRNDSWCLGMKSICDKDLKRFEELIPFYVTGMLSDGDRNYCDECLASNQIARASLSITHCLKSAVQSVGSKRDVGVGLNHLVKSLKSGREADHSSRRLKI